MCKVNKVQDNGCTWAINVRSRQVYRLADDDLVKSTDGRTGEGKGYDDLRLSKKGADHVVPDQTADHIRSNQPSMSKQDNQESVHVNTRQRRTLTSAQVNQHKKSMPVAQWLIYRPFW